MVYRLQAAIPYYTNLPRDVVTNTSHWNWLGEGAPEGLDFANLTNSVAAFYETLFPDSLSTSTMAPWCNEELRVRIYDLLDPEPRAPVYEVTTPLTVNRATSGTVPPEVSIVLSFQAPPISGVSQGRRRGRWYIGALGQNCVSAGTVASFTAPNSTFVTTLCTAAEDLLDTAAGFDWEWGVWSSVAGSFAAITDGWVDQELDTQRRRGQVATARTTWPLP